MKLFEGKASVVLFALTVLFGGLSTVFRKAGVDRIHPLQFQVVASLVYILTGSFAAYLCYDRGLSSWSLGGVSYASAAVLMNTACSIAFMFLIRETNNVGLITSMVSLSMVVTMLFSTLFLGEVITPRGMLGAALILTGVFIASNK